MAEPFQWTGTVAETVREIQGRLSTAGVPEPRLEAELLVGHVLGTDRTRLLARFQDALSQEMLEALAPLVERRLLREPLSYLIGWREFYRLRFVVRPGVLIPRPETETLVEEALRLARTRYDGVPRIADVGCGCGAIAVALAVHLPGAHVYATDNTPATLEVAAENCQRHDVQDRVTLLFGDLLEPLARPADLLVANLPYVRSPDFARLQPEVLHEPRQTLDGGPDGLRVIFRLLDQLSARGWDRIAVLVECDPRQAQHLADEAQRRLPGAAVRVLQDLAQRDRAVEVLL